MNSIDTVPVIVAAAGSAVALLFLTAVTFVRAETLGAALLSAGINIAVAVVCVVGARSSGMVGPEDF